MPERPTGWFAACAAGDLKRGDVQSRRLFGESIALYRTESGRVRASFATCPHLGANLGRGTVCGEYLQCPFHHFAFDGDGKCVDTPYDGPVPRQARVRMLEVRERNGLILVWWDDEGRAPSWEVPEHDQQGWGLPRLKCFRFKGHPQDTTENSVDLGHFATVHGFSGVEMTERLQTDGPEMTARYRFIHHLGPAAWNVEFTARVFGLGYSLVEVHIPKLGSRVRLFVLPVPVENGEIELRLGAAAPDGPLGRLQRSIVSRATLWLLARDANQDIPIWKERVYLERPVLARGDGPIGPYRRWARQFYPSLQTQSSEVA
ncbi:MAG: Rieske 2Fe-2S domain-containing protein [Proteobacteria bacterium]|nr:Rieske 2Fe-2S domain-containing protein [Pseudomonadota bacterium]